MPPCYKAHCCKASAAQDSLLQGLISALTVKNAVYRNTPGEQYFTVSMETVKYCSPGVFRYTAFFTVLCLPVARLTAARPHQRPSSLLSRRGLSIYNYAFILVTGYETKVVLLH